HSVALLAPLLFFAGYALTGEQYELARVDALFILLIVAAVLLGVTGAGDLRITHDALHTRYSLLPSAVCLALAFFTKQTTVVFIVGVAAYLFIVQRSRVWMFGVTLALLLLLPLGWMDRVTGGWSTTYLFVIPQSDPIEFSRIGTYLRSDLARHLGPLVLLCVA